MDIWAVSFKESLLDFIGKEMKAYRLYTVVPRLTKFIDQLTNWYVRLNRRRIKGEFGTNDCQASLNTLFDILFSMTKMMAPFTPFLTEFMYQKLYKFIATEDSTASSVHYEMMPAVQTKRIDKEIEKQVTNMQRVIELGRILRDRKTIPIKYPLPEIIILMTTADEQELKSEFKNLEMFIKNELNVRDIIYTNDKSKFGVKMTCEPDHKVLGTKFKANYKKITEMIKGLGEAEIEQVQKDGVLTLKLSEKESVEINIDELRFLIKLENTGERNLIGESDQDLLVLLNVHQDQSLMEEGLAREIINRIQKLKKKLNLVQTDLVYIFYKIDQGNEDVLTKYKSYIETAIKSEFSNETKIKSYDQNLGCLAEEEVFIQNSDLKLKIAVYKETQKMNQNFVNVKLLGTNKIQDASVLVTDDLSFDQFQTELKNLYQIPRRKHLHLLNKSKQEVDAANFKLFKFLYLYLEENENFVHESGAELWETVAKEDQPYCKFVNFTDSGSKRKFSFFVENPKGTVNFAETGELVNTLQKCFKCGRVDDLQFSV